MPNTNVPRWRPGKYAKGDLVRPPGIPGVYYCNVEGGFTSVAFGKELLLGQWGSATQSGGLDCGGVPICTTLSTLAAQVATLQGQMAAVQTDIGELEQNGVGFLKRETINYNSAIVRHATFAHSTSHTLAAANLIYYVPFTFGADNRALLDLISIGVIKTTGAAVTFRLGLYTMLASGAPGARLAEGVNITTGATGLVENTFTGLADLVWGQRYFAAYIQSTVNAVVNGATVGDNYPHVNTLGGYGYYTEAQAFGTALPANATGVQFAGVSTSYPIIYLGLQ